MATKAKVLVTGASGFLGSHCVKKLLGEGYRVRGTVRSTKNEQKTKPITDLDTDGRLELTEADLLKSDGWDKAVEGCEFVLHVASPFPSIGSADEATVKTAIDGTLNVLRAVAASDTVKRVVLTSSMIAVMGGRQVDEKVFDESDWTDDANPHVDAYGRSKVLAERAAWDFIKTNSGHQFELAVINPSFIIGPLLHKTECTSAELIKLIMHRGMPMVPAISMPCCDVRDVASAHLVAMTCPDAVNNRHLVCCMPAYNFLDIAKDLNQEFGPQGYKIPTTKCPYVVMWLGSWFDKKLTHALPAYGKETKVDNSRMKDVLGIAPIDQKTSIIDMAYSLVENGIVKRTPGYVPRKPDEKAAL